ncbi:MAG: hypothetical protein JXB05_11565 [Myxococcaceae bacterium]|nr:hypothetical protein [Myxococcaceae bacterium]
MLRTWLCIGFLFLTPGGGGLLPLVQGDVCEQGCPDDDARGQCAPDCADCTCCSHVRSVVLAPSAIVLLSLPRPSFFGQEDDEPASADLGDILHVPIARPA